MTMESEAAVPPIGHEPMRKGALGEWWGQGARTAFLLRPDWTGLQATPSNVAWLVAVPFAFGILLQRLVIEGAANFYWPALLTGWLQTALAAWLCWWLVPGGSPPRSPHQAPGPAALFALLAAQGLVLEAALALFTLALQRGDDIDLAAISPWADWAVSLALLAWYEAAALSLSWRSSPARRRVKLAACALSLAATAAIQFSPTARMWYPARPEESTHEQQTLKLTQGLMESQPRLLAQQLDALRPSRPGAIDVYAITFAPYGAQDVFRRESQVVAEVMQQRFDSAGRTIQLVNHPRTADQWPWATPLNLERAIRRVAGLMDRMEDVLFIHLSSHGAQSGALSASLWPMEVEEVTPAMLRQWLDEAGIRWRVVSVSACHSGSWIEPLSGPGTLAMTASDVEHTSYGCGSRSELTFFGRAMYDEQLRQTRSFEQAHAAARTSIEQREREAGKTDGYSNPQISMGDDVRQQLETLRAQLEARLP
jgi:hypothetical protein